MTHRILLASYLLLAVAFTSIPAASVSVAQDHAKTVLPESAPGEPVCNLPPDFVSRNVRLVPPRSAQKTAAASTFSVTYVDDAPAEPWPAAAKAAFEYATGLWEKVVASAVEIRVEAHWSNLGGCDQSPISLGSAGAYRRWRNGTLPQADTWYPDALADALVGTDICSLTGCDGDPDIIAMFNRECDDHGAAVSWYYGTDGDPSSGKTDFVSVVLHEIGHGLGFAGAGQVASGMGTVRTGSPADPYIYDQATQEGLGNSLIVDFADLSTGLGSALVGDSSGVFFDAPNAKAANGGSPPRLYSPNPWRSGSSYSHLDESTFNSSTNALMTPQLSAGEAVHVMGSVTCGVFEDMGWTIAAPSCDLALPVELASFDAVVRDGAILFTWETLSEQNNSGFEVRRQHEDGSWRSEGFVGGSGSSTERQTYEFRLSDPEPGTNRFQLAQVDFDGTVQIAGDVEVYVELASAFDITEAYPNPFNPQSAFYVTARESQPATVEVFDAAGRRVGVLFEGMLEANGRQKILIDGSSWPSGVYVYRVSAERFSQTGKIVLVK